MQMTGKILFAITLILGLAVPVTGLDFGFTIDSATGVRQGAESDAKLSHADTISFWGVRHQGDSPVGFVWRAWYRYSLDRPVAFELDELYLTARIGGDSAETAIRAGRFTHRDWGGTVFNHPQDGVRATISAGPADIRLMTGTTALIAGHRSTIFLSSLDEENRDATFGSPRVVSGLGLRLPSILPGFTPTLEGIAQFEVRPDDDVAYNSQYLTLRLDQAVGGSLSAETLGTLMLAQDNDGGVENKILGHYAHAGLQYVRPELSGLSLGLRGWHASGISGPPREVGEYLVGSFQPISIHRVASVIPVPVGGTMGGRLRASVKPFGESAAVWLQETQLSSHVTPLLRSTDLVVPVEQVDPDSDDLYLGTEIGAGFEMRPAPDFGLRIGGGVFLPGAAMADSSVRWQVSTNLSVTF
ncbi:hypothetical protein [Spirochaeta africana]|uniref:Uncharacterized protein n=1 Tax=Spirochaeta africana (strain ATCC 700263 / DSM 8902 / Z-7692) TaxID=889378 RepID=H9UFM4_SPIAZ|nr:hypothetical protein [Spirochaeta africana]AFG36317.1 hypothetical protein Spiaf_0208 [Spirochaeta africana DSM 8902]